MVENQDSQMEVDMVADQTDRILLRDRFEKIERARPAIPHVLIKA